MKPKVILTALLLLFVALSVGYMIARDDRSAADGEAGQSADVSSTAAVDNEDAVIAYYFHYTRRCATCNKIEELSNRVMTEQFSDELRDGRLIWKVLNVEEPEYKHFEEDYSLISQSLVLVDAREGKGMKWKNLEKIWELVHNDNEFMNYVRNEVRAFLESN
jgi:hypothetical protein